MTTDPTSHPAGRGDVYGRKMSSSADLSSPPPKSPESPFEEDAIVVYSGPPVIPMGSTTTATITSSSSVPKIEAPAKPKRIRKPRLAPDGTEIKPKPRKSRAKKKDPEPTLSEPMIPAPSLETAENRPQTPTQNTSKSSRQSRINELMNSVGNNVIVTRNQNPEPIIKTDDPIGTKSEAIPTLSDMSEILVNTDRSPSIQHHQQPTSHTTLPTSSRGQNYDPIRSSTITAQRSVLITNSSTPPVQVSPIKSVTRATASPSIASLINPPSDPVLNNPKSSFPPAQPLPAQLTPAQLTQSFQTLQDSPIIIQAPIPMPLVKQPAIPMESIDSMDIDPKPTTNSRKTSASAASATSPHPTKQKDKPSGVTPKLPPLPGQGYANSKVSGARAIVINVPLNGARNQYVNFQQLAVQKYGCDVVWPKLALQRDHLARVAANAAALERKPGVTTSNDDMSIDGSDNEAELSAGSKRKVPAGIEEQPAKKKRLTYEDMYDKDDPFVDDTEMAWEEQAAAVKDGFFVYSGLLVPAGGEANVEKADGSAAPKKRARPSKPAATKSAASKTSKVNTDDKDKKADETADAKGAATSGMKDTTEIKKPKAAAPRKRYTKAETEARKIERERIAREKAALASGASNGTSMNITAATENTAGSSNLTSAAPTADSTPKQTPAVPLPT